MALPEPRALQDNEFPFADTLAARMLRTSLRRASDERGLSLRRLAKMLGYKQATVLSHMSKGRVPIPLERSIEIAQVVGLPHAEFLRAVVAQKAPQALEILSDSEHREGALSTNFVAQLTNLAGGPLESLNDEQKQVLREVMLDRAPARRWLSPNEMIIMMHLRKLRPNLERHGLTPSELKSLEEALNAIG